MMYETKLIKVYLSNWQRYIHSLTINLLTLVILSLGALTNLKQVTAQVAANESNPKQEEEGNRNNVQATLEPKILAEINRVRTNPQDYAQWLEKQRQYYDGIWLRLPGERAVRTNKGQKALEEAIAFLKEQQPLPPLKTSSQASDAANSELDNFATAKNIQYFSYGRKTAEGIVMGLVVDDLFPDRRRRASLLNPDVENTGVVCKSDPRYAKVCAIAYSDLEGTADIAQVKPETNKPETNKPDNEAAVDVPEIFTTAESLTTPKNPETSESTKPEAESTSSTPENTENTDISTLPAPPQPQAPPTPSISEEEQPNQSTEAESKDLEDLDVAQIEANESETEATIEEETATAEAESALEIEPEVESNTEEVVEDDSQSVDEAEAEIAEIIEEDSEQVAINSDRLLEKVERGALEKGDRVIEDDGSLYDFYPLEGSAGDSFNIYLESDQFDTFVALVDSNGNTIKENDDISEEDSNSRIRVTLPENGTYNIIVNTYDEQGTGNYVLTVSR